MIARSGSKPVDTLISFKFGEAFPPGDVLAEWLATLALAFNDIAYVHRQFDETWDRPAYDYFYFLRVALGHFNEAAAFPRQYGNDSGGHGVREVAH